MRLIFLPIYVRYSDQSQIKYPYRFTLKSIFTEIIIMK